MKIPQILTLIPSFDLIFETFNRTFAAYNTREQEQCENI